MKNKRSKWCFATGCSGRDMCYNLVSMFFLMYVQYTNLLNKEQYAVLTTIVVICRVWDAINDPIIGSFPDRWRLGNSGNKFTPWIKLFMIPLALSGVLCFTAVPFEGAILHAWVAAVYIFYGMCYTGTSMPFGAMANVVSQDPIEHNRLNTRLKKSLVNGTEALAPLLFAQRIYVV